MNWWRQNGWVIFYPVVALMFTVGVFVAVYFVALAVSS